MLGKTEILDTSPTGQGVPVPVTQLSPQESAGLRGSRQCGPRDITALAPTQRHLTCHYLLLDQADCDPML